MKWGMAEEQALEHEKYMISLFKPLGWLHNFTDGGDGVSGYVYTDQDKAKISESQIPQMIACAKKYGIDPDVYLAMPQSERDYYHKRFGRYGHCDQIPGWRQNAANAKARKAAEKYGVPLAWWCEQTPYEKKFINLLFQKGLSGDQLMSHEKRTYKRTSTSLATPS